MEEKECYIKAWLQRFGERDNETFSIQLNKWHLMMQYDWSLEGYRIEPRDWCSSEFKHVFNNGLEDRSIEELDEIIKELDAIKTYW